MSFRCDCSRECGNSVDISGSGHGGIEVEVTIAGNHGSQSFVVEVSSYDAEDFVRSVLEAAGMKSYTVRDEGEDKVEREEVTP